MTVTVHTLNAFAKTPEGGNPAGVVFEADGLNDAGMQGIAAQIGFSETAFVQKSERADFKLRFFTPTGEVELCGHATVAAFCLMAQRDMLRAGRCTQETKAGILQVEILPGKTVFMNQNKPDFSAEVPKSGLADSLNIPVDFIMERCPAQIVSTGLRDILIPINTLEQLYSIQPDFDKITAVSRKYGVIGYHLFTFETKREAAAHCRNFAPLYDIPEEAATGTSNGALGCYLYRYGLLGGKDPGSLVFEQGYSMRRPSEILCGLVTERGEITEVKVGGTARYTGKREIELSV